MQNVRVFLSRGGVIEVQAEGSDDEIRGFYNVGTELHVPGCAVEYQNVVFVQIDPDADELPPQSDASRMAIEAVRLGDAYRERAGWTFRPMASPASSGLVDIFDDDTGERIALGMRPELAQLLCGFLEAAFKSSTR